MSKVSTTEAEAKKLNGSSTVKERTVEEFATDIIAAWNKSVTSIIRTGRLLKKMKRQHGHGKWLAMLTQKDFPFGERTAEMLMKIAKDPVLSNPKFVSDLPRSWSVLYALTEIPEPELTDLIEQKKITSTTSKKQVKEIAEKIAQEGVDNYDKLDEALHMVAKFMKKYPEPKELAGHLNDLNVSPDHLKAMPSWIGKLHAFWEEEATERDAEADEDLRRMAAERKRQEEEREKVKKPKKKRGPNIGHFNLPQYRGKVVREAEDART